MLVNQSHRQDTSFGNQPPCAYCLTSAWLGWDSSFDIVERERLLLFSDRKGRPISLSRLAFSNPGMKDSPFSKDQPLIIACVGQLIHKRTWLDRPMSSSQIHYETDNEEDKENEEQYLCYAHQSDSYAHETENARNERNNEE